MEKGRDYGMFTNTESNLSDGCFEGINLIRAVFIGANLKSLTLKGLTLEKLTSRKLNLIGLYLEGLTL